MTTKQKLTVAGILGLAVLSVLVIWGISRPNYSNKLGSFSVTRQIGWDRPISLVTTEVTTTTLFTVTMPDTTSTVIISGDLSFNSTTGTDGGGGQFSAVFKKTSTTTVTTIYSPSIALNASGVLASRAAANFVTSSNAVSLQVSGVASTTVNWASVYTPVFSR